MAPFGPNKAPPVGAVAELEINYRGGYFQHWRGHNGGARNEPVET